MAKPTPKYVFPDTEANYQKTVVQPREEALQAAKEQEKRDIGAGQAQAALVASIVPPDGTYRQLGYQIALEYGWGGYWAQIDALITRESGWNNYARNPYSTACGIGQDINGCEVGYDPRAQIQWAYDYISGRYGTPAGAWNHSQMTGWY